jgi:chromosome segregation protein
MQLSKLEVKGFKSFGDKVTINFDEGITGIVGPNGCGKSNVVDAIRWVLGEQKTKALRSDKMENIIFNGTKKRKPTQMAEVSLTFNNTKNLLPTEYSQVTITRKYYRSGDSEYLLNGVVCRLKDITNLFLDTGIASNSYAIIELKMVDDLLNDKDNSRRGLFEEAAGISKFKKRKKETLKKLEDTDADLERVEDLLFEIEKNMKSLERQAKQTEKYYKIKEEYQSLSILLAKLSIRKQTQTFQTLSKQITSENDSKISLSKQITEKEARIEKDKKELVTKEKTLATRQKSLNEHVNNIRQYESDKKIKNERLKYLNDKSERLRDQIDQDRQSSERAGFSIQGLEQEKSSAEKLLLESEHELTNLKEAYETQKATWEHVKNETDSLNDFYQSKQQETYQLNKEVEIKEIQRSSLKQELEKTTSDSSEKTTNLVEFENRTKLLEEELLVKNKTLKQLKEEEETTKNRIESIENTINVIKEEVAQLNRKIDARQNEYNLTKSLVENLEGFPEAIKFLKKQTDWKKDAPLLTDVLTCPAGYRIAIENYLESYLNYYIVNTEEEAYQAVNILSDSSKGKAHFFVLDALGKYLPATSKMYENAFPATEIIEYDERYKKLMSHILDNVYICESDHNIPNDSEAIFITKSGKVIKKRYSISGGSVGLFEGKKIGRAKNLEKLEKEIKTLNTKLTKSQQSLDDKQAEHDQLKSSTKSSTIDELQTEINLINEEYISVKTKKEQFSEMINTAGIKREDISIQIGQLAEEIEAHKPKAEAEHAVLLKSEEKLVLLKEQLNNENEVLNQKSTVFNERNILFHQHENKVDGLAKEIAYKQEALNSSKLRIAHNQVELTSNEGEIKALIAKSDSGDDTLINMYEEKETIEAGVVEAEKTYYSGRGDIEELEKDIREIQRNREHVDALLMELQNTLNDTKLELTSVKERLSVEFNVDLDQLVLEDKDTDQSTEEQVNESELAENVAKLKHRIDQIGPINPMAMEAYNEIKERNDFIVVQREDLFKAKDSLLSTIEEIDGVAKETFLEAYDKIKENFIKVFRSLFTEEDDCDLRLVDPDNPLESKIEIMAKPKGKRPLTINQLSGGEKTLTAISLLFAIYLLKPAPFCIFDEVDAPLDDANIDKFNNIIKKFSTDSQFIIVTHNKRTMASTDVIYGITMIEQGVSRVVPVDLRELA